MITAKDLAPLDDASFELWRKELKHRKAKTLLDLYLFCQDFFGWACYKDMPYVLRYYNVWYFEYIEKDKFEIVLC